MRTSTPTASVACCAHQVQNFDLSQRFWCRGLWGVGFNGQIFGADKQVSGTVAKRLRTVRPYSLSSVGAEAGRAESLRSRSASLPRSSMAGAFSIHGIDEQIFGADEQVLGRGQSD